jgi:hypothetical protein
MPEIRVLPQLSLVSLTTEATEHNCAMDGVDTVTISTPSIASSLFLSQLPVASYFPSWLQATLGSVLYMPDCIDIFSFNRTTENRSNPMRSPADHFHVADFDTAGSGVGHEYRGRQLSQLRSEPGQQLRICNNVGLRQQTLIENHNRRGYPPPGTGVGPLRVAGVVAVERDGSVFRGDGKITASMLPSIN